MPQSNDDKNLEILGQQLNSGQFSTEQLADQLYHSGYTKNEAHQMLTNASLKMGAPSGSGASNTYNPQLGRSTPPAPTTIGGQLGEVGSNILDKIKGVVSGVQNAVNTPPPPGTHAGILDALTGGIASAPKTAYDAIKGIAGNAWNESKQAMADVDTRNPASQNPISNFLQKAVAGLPLIGPGLAKHGTELAEGHIAEGLAGDVATLAPYAKTEDIAAGISKMLGPVRSQGKRIYATALQLPKTLRPEERAAVEATSAAQRVKLGSDAAARIGSLDDPNTYLGKLQTEQDEAIHAAQAAHPDDRIPTSEIAGKLREKVEKLKPGGDATKEVRSVLQNHIDDLTTSAKPPETPVGVAYHSTRSSGDAMGILKSGQINVSGPTVYHAPGSAGGAWRGVSIATKDVPKFTEDSPVTFTLDHSKVGNTTPYDMFDRKQWGGSPGGPEDPRFEYEERTHGTPIPIDAVKEIVINPKSRFGWGEDKDAAIDTIKAEAKKQQIPVRIKGEPIASEQYTNSRVPRPDMSYGEAQDAKKAVNSVISGTKFAGTSPEAVEAAKTQAQMAITDGYHDALEARVPGSAGGRSLHDINQDIHNGITAKNNIERLERENPGAAFRGFPSVIAGLALAGGGSGLGLAAHTLGAGPGTTMLGAGIGGLLTAQQLAKMPKYGLPAGLAIMDVGKGGVTHALGHAAQAAEVLRRLNLSKGSRSSMRDEAGTGGSVGVGGATSPPL